MKKMALLAMAMFMVTTFCVTDSFAAQLWYECHVSQAGLTNPIAGMDTFGFNITEASSPSLFGPIWVYCPTTDPLSRELLAVALTAVALKKKVWAYTETTNGGWITKMILQKDY
jgi:hypothetical protein